MQLIRRDGEIGLWFDAGSAAALAKLVDEATRVGGLMLPQVSGVALNESVSLALAWGGQAHWFKGRVVFVGPAGVAFEVQRLSDAEGGRWPEFGAGRGVAMPSVSAAPVAPAVPVAPVAPVAPAVSAAGLGRAVSASFTGARPQHTAVYAAAVPGDVGELPDGRGEHRPVAQPFGGPPRTVISPPHRPTTVAYGQGRVSGAWDAWRVSSLAEAMAVATGGEEESFGDGQCPRILACAARRREDMLIEVRSGAVAYRLGLQSGLAALGESEHEGRVEDLGEYLRSTGRISSGMYESTRSKSQAEGLPFERVLVKSGHLAYDELLMAARVRIGKVLTQMAGLESGVVRVVVVEELPLVLPVAPIGVERFLFGWLVDKIDKGDPSGVTPLWDAMQDLMPCMDKGTWPLINALGLSGGDLRVVELIRDQKLRLRDLPARTRLTRGRLLGIVTGLERMGMLALAKPEVKDQAKVLAEALLVRAKHVLTVDHFEALGVHWSAYQQAIEEGYQKQREAFSVETLPVGVRQSAAGVLGEVAKRLDEAYGVLRDRIERARYRASIVNSVQITTGVRLYLDQAEWALIRGEVKVATDATYRIAELEPGHPKLPELRNKLRR